MKHYALEIHVQPDNTALCFISSPAYGVAPLSIKNAVQCLALNDGANRVLVGVTGRAISIEDVKRLARQALNGDFDARG